MTTKFIILIKKKRELVKPSDDFIVLWLVGLKYSKN